MKESIQRFVSIDIECTGLDASYGRLVCICLKFEDEEKVRTKSIRSVKQEKALLEWFKKQYEEVDVIMTWNGKMFDIPFINARLMYHDLETLVPKKHLDLMYKAKAIRTRGARLDGVAKDLKFDFQKIDVPAWRWVLAAEGDKESIDMIVEHCEQDVLMTEEAARRFRPMIVKINK